MKCKLSQWELSLYEPVSRSRGELTFIIPNREIHLLQQTTYVKLQRHCEKQAE